MLVAPDALPASYRVHGARAGITLLHPWANRLGPGARSAHHRALIFDADDRTVSRDSNGLPIHGLASESGWNVERVGATRCHAQLSAPSVKAFPFPHRVDVTLELVKQSHLAVETTVTCTEDVHVPVAFGWHTYFRFERSADAELVLPRRDRVALDDLGLPTGSRRTEPTGHVRIGRRHLDNNYVGISDGSSLSLHADHGAIDVIHELGFASAQIFAPLDAPVLSLEPMTAPTNALRTGLGLRFAGPQDPFTARFSIRVSEAPTAPRRAAGRAPR